MWCHDCLSHSYDRGFLLGGKDLSVAQVSSEASGSHATQPWPVCCRGEGSKEADRNMPLSLPWEVPRHLPNLENQTRLYDEEKQQIWLWVALPKSCLPPSLSFSVWQISMRLSWYFYNSLPSGTHQPRRICSSLCCILRGCPTSTVMLHTPSKNRFTITADSSEDCVLSSKANKVMCTKLRGTLLWTETVC